jgi:adenylate cyclase
LKPTLGQVFVATILGLGLLLLILFQLLNKSSESALLQTSMAVREERTRRIAENVVANVEKKSLSLRRLEGLLREGAIRIDDPVSIEAALFAEVVGEEEVSEATLTHAVLRGRNATGVELEPGDRWQISVYRTYEGEGPPRIVTRTARQEKGRFVCETRERPVRGAFQSAPFVRQALAEVPDPTADLTFQAAALNEDPTRPVASDLHWFEHDQALPAPQRRVGVSGQKAVRDAEGRFLGVLRVGLLTRSLDALVRRPSPEDPHWVFFCDTRGRLISAIGSGDTLQEDGDDLRVVPASMPPEIAAAVRQPVLRALEPDADKAQFAEFEIQGERYFATYRYVTHSLDWVAVMVAPESAYLGPLSRQRKWVLLTCLGIMAAILVLGSLTLRTVRRGLGAIEGTTARMRDFDFSPAPVRLPLRDLQDVGERLEVAKTAMRAMGRYVPVDLVRLLFKTGREPALGGDLLEVTLLFTDVQGFTTISEKMEPNALARALGRYFEVMTQAIHQHRGVIDKYIGDGIMALWNAPTPTPEHARRACEAALACVGATAALYTSPEWAGLPPLVTRFGIHRDRVMVGHFGAPDRMSYTALGDGVNLASRLEGLNKAYGTAIMVSEPVHAETAPHFRFRLLDRAAVKGKTRGIAVYELLGPAESTVPPFVTAYEAALHAYWGRDFAGAAAILEGQPEDPPSRVLLERCRRLAAAPPPADWDGTWVATAK